MIKTRIALALEPKLLSTEIEIAITKFRKVLLSPILQNLKGRYVLDNFFFENVPLDEPKKSNFSGN